MSERLTIEGQVNRNAKAIPCPKCNGYADRVDLTKEEIKNQSCHRSYACCGRAFICRVCKARIVGEAESPEMSD